MLGADRSRCDSRLEYSAVCVASAPSLNEPTEGPLGTERGRQQWSAARATLMPHLCTQLTLIQPFPSNTNACSKKPTGTAISPVTRPQDWKRAKEDKVACASPPQELYYAIFALLACGFNLAQLISMLCRIEMNEMD